MTGPSGRHGPWGQTDLWGCGGRVAEGRGIRAALRGKSKKVGARQTPPKTETVAENRRRSRERVVVADWKT